MRLIQDGKIFTVGLFSRSFIDPCSKTIISNALELATGFFTSGGGW